MDPNTHNRAEAERWLGISVKLLTTRDFLGSKTFAIRAREADPTNDVSDQVLAVVETVLAGEKRVNPSQHPDWYTVLQLPRLVRDPDLIANHYRRLVTLLNPERNRVPFADYALQLVMDAWSILSDPNKKWLFDNELALYLQRAVEQQQQQQHHEQPQQPQQQQPLEQNTFQFFQPPQQPTVSTWQNQNQNQNMSQQFNNGNQVNQIEFMQPQPQPQPQPPLQPPQQLPEQELPPQWQMRDPTPSKGGERNKGVPPPPKPVAPPQPQPPPVVIPPTVVEGNVGNVVINNVVNNSDANNNAGVVHENANNANANANANANDNGVIANANANADAVADDVVGNEINDGEVEEEVVESFWTSCPYCLYIFEYPKVYQECTLKCQNCGRGFHGVQIPNPPPISGRGGSEGGEKGKESSFCCWGFFPLGFDMAVWKKQNRVGKSNVGVNWVPFSPMFACPVENGGGKFQWFESSGSGAIGPKNLGRPRVSRPRVYVDDDEDDFDFNSDPSDSDSSDNDWRQNPTYVKKRKKERRRKVGLGRPPKKVKQQVVDVQNRVNHRPVTRSGGGVSVRGEDLKDESRSGGGGGVSVRGEDSKDESNTQDVVLGLTAGDKEPKEGARKKVAASGTLTRSQARRRMKNMGRLDLNVEFNNEGDEHAPTVSAVNGGEVGVENIEFFEGLDEFFSTLPILNVGGDEKARPS